MCEDKTPHVLLADEIDITALLLAPRGSSKLGFQVTALNPAGDDMRVDPESFCHKKVGETIGLAIKAGAIGCNLEDSFPENGSLREIKQPVDRIRHARQKTKETDVDFFINARTDVFIHVPQDQHDAPLVAQALERAQAYAEAGADGLFVPGLANLALISDLAKASPLPVNIMVNEGTNIRALATRGVARVSFGAAPYILMMTALREATQRAILK